MLLCTMHHIISDGWSMGVLIRELTHSLRSLRDGKPSPLPELEIQYADFAHWQREWLQGEVLERQLSYWKNSWLARRRCWSCRQIIRARRCRRSAARISR